MLTLLSIFIAGATAISSILALHKNNHYSWETKVLKVGPRVVLGLQFFVAPFLVNNLQISYINSVNYNLSEDISVILWGLLMFFISEIIIQLLNIRLGRAEKK